MISPCRAGPTLRCRVKYRSSDFTILILKKNLKVCLYIFPGEGLSQHQRVENKNFKINLQKLSDSELIR